MQLCQSEWTVLQSLWERQPQTLMQLVEDLKLRAGWSASTSKTMAARMTEKGLLRYEGKPRRYYPNVTREEAGLEETEQLLSRAFGGKLGLLVSNFADHGKIGKDELEELYAILDRAAGREDEGRGVMLEILISSTVLILALTALRFFLRGKLNPRLQYTLWLLAALRLLLPVSLVRSPVSVMNAAADVPAAVQRPGADCL